MEIAEACRKATKYPKATVGGNRTSAQWPGLAIATEAARLLLGRCDSFVGLTACGAGVGLGEAEGHVRPPLTDWIQFW